MKTKKSNKLAAGYVEILHSRYYVHAEPDPNSERIRKTSAGEHIPYYGKVSKEWLEVCADGEPGYISKQAGKVIEVKQTYLTVKKGNWHVRTAPNTKAKSLGKIVGGSKILYQGEDKDGFKLVVFDNQNAWITTKAFEKEA